LIHFYKRIMPLLGCRSSDDELPTYFAIQLHFRCSDQAAQYIHDNLKLDWNKGGGGLVVRRQLPTPVFPETVFHVACSTGHLIMLAEIMEMRKEDKDGHVRLLTRESWEEFPESGRVGPLSISDIHRCVQYAINRIHFDHSVETLPGQEHLKVIKGAPVISSYQEKNLVTMFPVHDEEELAKLSVYWKQHMMSPPLDEIRNYFGESVAFYWSFSNYYNKLLILIATLGVLEWVMEYQGINYIYSNVLFSFFNLLALAIFCEMWKRKSNEHSFFWGTSGKLRLKPPRPEYRGELKKHPVTGKLEMFYSDKKRLSQIFFISVPLTILCLVVAFFLMVCSFEADRMMMEFLLDPETGEASNDLFSTILSNIPSILYSLVIIIFNSIYLKIARKLTVKENHRTEEQHNLHITFKLISFEFVNTFLALFYVGFWLQDIAALRAQLFTTLLVQQIVNQVQEVVIPNFLHKPSSMKFLYRTGKKLGLNDTPQKRNISGVTDLDGDDDRVRAVQHDTLADPLDSLHDDFMELWLQYGHVFLFAAVYPLSAVIALANNFTELYADKYKLCRLSRKPKPVAVRDIGGWYLAFRLTAIVSIISNCGLIALDLRNTAGEEWSDVEWFRMFVIIEHIFVVIFLGINRLISDTSKRVKLSMDRADYHFKERLVAAEK